MTDTPQKPRPRVLSGMRPTGKLHLGNYVGALQNWVKLQNSHDCFFFVADWHALTTDYDDTSRLADNSLEVVLDFLAAGLDPERCAIFVQSHVREHAELHLLFSMITPLGWLERVPSYKEQQQQMPNKDLHMYGFLGYPLLQAADILLYRPDFVPVGEDQSAHIELTREVARRFNQFYQLNYKPVFPEPQILLTPSPKLLGTDKRKMSKSYDNSILMSDEAAVVEQKIKNSVTDRPKLTDRGSPDRCPVGNLHQIFSDRERLAHITEGCTQASITCVECKALAIESVNAHLAPIRERRHALVEHQTKLIEIVRYGAEKATKNAEETMIAARSAIGLLQTINISGTSTGKSSATGTLHGTANASTVTAEMAPSKAVDSDKTLFLLPEELKGLDSIERGDRRRDVWLKRMRRVYILRDVGHRTFVTGKNRRIGVPTSGEHADNRWVFSIGDRTYDALVLLCHADSGEIIDFVIPRKFLKGWESFKREGKNVSFEVQQTPGGFFLGGVQETPQNITKFRQNYSVLE
jgi:tryptophanyl-tRNA synthetase